MAIINSDPSYIMENSLSIRQDNKIIKFPSIEVKNNYERNLEEVNDRISHWIKPKIKEYEDIKKYKAKNLFLELFIIFLASCFMAIAPAAICFVAIKIFSTHILSIEMSRETFVNILITTYILILVSYCIYEQAKFYIKYVKIKKYPFDVAFKKELEEHNQSKIEYLKKFNDEFMTKNPQVKIIEI